MRTRPLPLFALLSMMLSTLVLLPPDLSAQNEQIRRDVMTAGSGSASGGGLVVRGSISQTAIGPARRPEAGPDPVRAFAGFWHNGIRPLITTIVTIPDLEANVATEITVPISVRTLGALESFVPRPFTMRIRFNGSLMHPIEGTPDCEWEGSDCTIEIAGTADRLEGVIAELRFLTALGNAESTPIEVVEFAWEKRAEERITIVPEHGSLRLLDVCREGDGPRLIRSGTAARLQVRPNPARTTATLEYLGNQFGHVTIDLVDLLGNRVRRIVADEIRPDLLYREELDLSEIPAGSYVVVYRTPEATLTRRLIVRE